jgi:preprotein translocase subunit SecD
MDRGWYVRFTVVITLVVAACLALWPSLEMAFDDLPGAPPWVQETFSGRISPGLDIQGGLRLMYEVEVDEAVRDRRDREADRLIKRLGVLLELIEEDEWDEVSREQLDEIREKVQAHRVEKDAIRLTFTDAGDAELVDRDWLEEYFPDLRMGAVQGNQINFQIREERLEALREGAVEQAVKTINNRVDEMQVREMTVIGRGEDIIVEIPGADQASFDRIREVISRTARLEFKVLEDESTFIADLADLPEGIEKDRETVSAGESRPSVVSTFLVARGDQSRQLLMEYVAGLSVPEGREVMIGAHQTEETAEQNEEAWRTYFAFDTTEVTGEDVDDAYVGYDSQDQSRPVVQLQFNGEGADSFGRMTGENVKRRMAIVLDNRVESAPVINERIGGGRCQITLGSYRDYNELLEEANGLVIVLKAGALPAPIVPANEQLIGPTLGRDSVKQGAEGAVIGIALVLIFMLVYYQVAGIVADAMVLMNLLFLMAILAFFEATLTLPGIAGIALTVGMAVDANVLITERIREELRLGKSPRSAVDQGFGRAFWSIFDSQVTTFIAGVVLFQYGTGPIKGFAVTLMIGIATSLFTGVFCSKVALDWIVRGLRVTRLRVG